MQEKEKSTFVWLNATQALGALNDNLYKLLVIAYLIGKEGQLNAGKITAVAGAVFTMPFLVFTAYGGKLADQFSKRTITVILKIAEVAIMLSGMLAFWSGSEFFLYTVMFLMTTESAIFSPSKYGIIPELVEREELARANGLVETATYLAVIIAAVFVPPLVWAARNNFTLASSCCVVVAIAGTLTSLSIKKTTSLGQKGGSSLLFFAEIGRTLYRIRRNKALLPAIIASAYFLLIGVSITLVIIPFGLQYLSLDQTTSMYLFLPGTLGIAAGSLLAVRICGRGVEIGLVGLGSFFVALIASALCLLRNNLAAAFVLIFLIGSSATLIIIPLNSYIQLHSPAERRGRIIAAANFLGWTGSFCAAILIYFLSAILQLSAAKTLFILSAMAGVMAAGCLVIMPALVLRAFLVSLVRICYRLQTRGYENIPSDGGVLFVSNHNSWSDALVLMAAQNRSIRFIMDKSFFNIWFLKPSCKILGCVPISEKDGPKLIEDSLRAARDAVNAGQAIGIFAEGAMTRNGNLKPFKRGLQMIIENAQCSVVPVYIGGTWGSIFSYYHGRPLSTFPRKFFRKVVVYFGKALPATATVEQIRENVAALAGKYQTEVKPT